MYSAGNFIDDYAVDPQERNDESFLFSIEAQGDRRNGLKLVPTMIGDCRAELAWGLDSARILKQTQRRCGRLGTRVTVRESKGVIPLGRSLARVSHG